MNCAKYDWWLVMKRQLAQYSRVDATSRRTTGSRYGFARTWL